jgi:hypothetical protein
VISGERIGYELRKILSQKFSDSFLKIFYEINISKYLGIKLRNLLKLDIFSINNNLIIKGLPLNADLNNYRTAYKNCFKYEPNPFTLLHSIIKSEDDVRKTLFKNKINNFLNIL